MVENDQEDRDEVIWNIPTSLMAWQQDIRVLMSGMTDNSEI